MMVARARCYCSSERASAHLLVASRSSSERIAQPNCKIGNSLERVTDDRRALSHDLSWSRQSPRRGSFIQSSNGPALTGAAPRGGGRNESIQNLPLRTLLTRGN